MSKDLEQGLFTVFVVQRLFIVSLTFIVHVHFSHTGILFYFLENSLHRWQIVLSWTERQRTQCCLCLGGDDVGLAVGLVFFFVVILVVIVVVVCVILRRRQRRSRPSRSVLLLLVVVLVVVVVVSGVAVAVAAAAAAAMIAHPDTVVPSSQPWVHQP